MHRARTTAPHHPKWQASPNLLWVPPSRGEPCRLHRNRSQPHLAFSSNISDQPLLFFGNAFKLLGMHTPTYLRLQALQECTQATPPGSASDLGGSEVCAGRRQGLHALEHPLHL